MAKTKHPEEICLHCELGNPQVADIVKLLNLFHADNLLIEVIGIVSSSPLITNLKKEKALFVSQQTLSSGIYTDVILPVITDDRFEHLLEDIIKSSPKQMSLYFTRFSLKQFLLCASDGLNFDCIVQSMIVESVINIDFDKNTMYVYFLADSTNSLAITQNSSVSFEKDNRRHFRWSHGCGTTDSSSLLNILKYFQVDKSRRTKEFNAAFVFDKSTSDLAAILTELLCLFHADNLIFKISGLGTNGSLYRKIVNSDLRFVVYPNYELEPQGYARALIQCSVSQALQFFMEEITLDNPGHITFYLTDLSLEQFLYNRRTQYNLDVPKVHNVGCTITIVLDESYIDVTFDTDLFNKSDIFKNLKQAVNRIR